MIISLFPPDTQGQVFDDARKTIFWMIAGLVITIVLFAFVAIITSYTRGLTQINSQMNAEFLVGRLVGAPECFAYQDAETHRVYPNVLDIRKLTKEVLDQCYITLSDQGFKDYNFELVVGDITLHTNNYFNHPDFTLSKMVLVRHKEKITPTRMEILVQEKI